VERKIDRRVWDEGMMKEYMCQKER